jgi:acetyl-CoA carboxylase alpha subunit
MQVIKRGKIVYYVKDEAVVAGVSGFQYMAFTVYPLQNRKPFYDFRRKIVKSGEDEYGTAAELLKLAQRFNLKGVASSKPKESE